MRLRESGMPDEELWRSFFSPAETLRRLQIEESTGDVIDIGAGYGTFSLAAATLADGEVCAVDIDGNLLTALAEKAAHAGCENVRTVLADVAEEGTGLPDGRAGYVMIFNLLHCEHPERLLAEAHRLITPGGLLAVMHWVSDRPTPRGPSLEIRPLPEDCQRWATDAGFELREGPIDLPPYHYGMVFDRA